MYYNHPTIGSLPRQVLCSFHHGDTILCRSLVDAMYLGHKVLEVDVVISVVVEDQLLGIPLALDIEESPSIGASEAHSTNKYALRL